MIGYLVPTTSPHLATSAQSHRNPHPTLSSPFPSCPHAPRPPNCSRDIIRTGSDCCQLSTRKQTHQSYHRFTSYSRSVVSQPKSRADWSATFTEGAPASPRPQILEILDDVIQIQCQRQTPDPLWTATEATRAGPATVIATVEPVKSRAGQRRRSVGIHISHRFAVHPARASTNIYHR